MSRIILFKADNFQKLKAIEFEPDEHLVKICGQNGQGKTSILESIKTTLLGGQNLETHIQNGQKKSSVTLETDDYIIEQDITAKKTYLRLIDKKTGTDINAPRTAIQKIAGKLGYDPIQFISQSPKEQIDNFLKLNGIDLSDIDSQIKQIYDWRTHKGRQVKDSEGECKVYDRDKYRDLPDNPIDIGQLTKDYQSALDYNHEVKNKEGRLLASNSKIEELQSKKIELNKMLANIEIEMAAEEENNDKLSNEVQNSAIVDTSEIEEKMAGANKTNNLILEKEKYLEAVKKRDTLKSEYSEETKKLEKIQSDKEILLKTIDIDLEGLGFTTDGFNFNQVPLNQCCKSEQLQVSIWIAMKMNPELKVILMPDFTLLDNSSQEAVAKMAIDNDFQIWAEIVTDEKEAGIFLEDGKIL